MTAKKVAVLDLGTNTFNLLLVKITPSAYYIFHNEKIPVKIGKDGINQGVITEEAKERALIAYTNIRRSLSVRRSQKFLDMQLVHFEMRKMAKSSGNLSSKRRDLRLILSLVIQKLSLSIKE